MVIDDHFQTRDMVKTILRSVGFQKIIQADDGSSAVYKLKDEPIDLIICDWNMPDMSGIEFLSVIRKNQYHSNVPFLMLTAEVYKENVQEAIEKGVTDYIAQPFTAETLINKVLEHVQIEK